MAKKAADDGPATLITYNGTSREDRYAAVMAGLAAGRTVYVLTARGAIKITPKLAAKWAATGRPVIKLAKGSLWLASGRRYDCIDFNHIQLGE